jgi:hypothetical protein
MAAQSVHRTTADEPDQTGCHEGPTIHFDRPPAGASVPLPSDSPLGPPLCGGECRADVRWEGRVRRNFSTVVGGQWRTSKKQRSTEKRWPSSDRRGREWVRRTAIATRAEQSRCQVGPTKSLSPAGRS